VERRLHWENSAGIVSFSLVETLVANGIVITVVVGVAQLFAVTTDANRRAAVQTWMAICAAQKLEELRTIDGDSAGGLEHLDAHGVHVPASRAVYERRWSIAPHDSDPARLLLLEVIVRSTVRPIEARASGAKRKRA
jgi:hypothetical protein